MNLPRIPYSSNPVFSHFGLSERTHHHPPCALMECAHTRVWRKCRLHTDSMWVYSVTSHVRYAAHPLLQSQLFLTFEISKSRPRLPVGSRRLSFGWGILLRHQGIPKTQHFHWPNPGSQSAYWLQEVALQKQMHMSVAM